MATEKLTTKQIEHANTKGRLSDGGGLYLDVKASGAKAWVYVWRGKRWVTPDNASGRREMGLGKYGLDKSGLVSLKKARELAAECRALVGEGIDPKRHRDQSNYQAKQEAAKKLYTFGSIALEYIEANEPSWKNAAHRRQWRFSTLGENIKKGSPDYCRSIRSKPVDEITRDDVLAILKPIWTEKMETAERIQGRIETVLDYAAEKRLRDGLNPATMKGNLRGSLPHIPKSKRVKHHKALPFEQVPTLVITLTQSEALSATVLLFIILNANRSGEAINARWSEIDLDGAMWSIPADRMKGSRLHEIPLSGQSAALLRPLYELRQSEYVFAGQKPNRPISAMAVDKTLKRYGGEGQTLHGLRSTFRDWCGETTNFERETVELALSHRIGDAAEQAYRRGAALEKRRVLMQAWADYAFGVAGDKVVPMHG
ncbi:MAG: integrase arm-type DNA-binding domain-containing protein [Hyphomicrobiales bacterium]